MRKTASQISEEVLTKVSKDIYYVDPTHDEYLSVTPPSNFEWGPGGTVFGATAGAGALGGGVYGAATSGGSLANRVAGGLVGSLLGGGIGMGTGLLTGYLADRFGDPKGYASRKEWFEDLDDELALLSKKEIRAHEPEDNPFDASDILYRSKE